MVPSSGKEAPPEFQEIQWLQNGHALRNLYIKRKQTRHRATTPKEASPVLYLCVRRPRKAHLHELRPPTHSAFSCYGVAGVGGMRDA